jgi:hypothetical protein
MASDDPGDASAVFDSRSEKVAVASAATIPADYDSALSQLNVLDAPGGVIVRDVESKCEHLHKKGPIGAAATDSDSAIALLSELCALVGATAPELDASGRIQGGSVNLDAAGETTKAVLAGSVFADDDAPTASSRSGAFGETKVVDAAPDDVLDEKANFNPRVEVAEIIAGPADYHSVLLQIVELAGNDPRELRGLVYELARTSLAKEIETGRSAPKDLKDLESAIARVEGDLSRGDRSDPPLPGFDIEPQQLDEGSARKKVPDTTSSVVKCDPNIEIVASSIVADESRFAGLVRLPSWPADQQVQRSEASGFRSVALSGGRAEGAPFEIVYPERDKSDAARIQRRIWLWFLVWPAVQLIGVAVFCLIIYLALAQRLDMQGLQIHQPVVAEVQKPPSVEPAGSSGLPLPSTYGVYAVSEGHLSELQPLPIRPPDPRVQLSAEINQPSSTTLPDGKVAFILFRRELLNSAPQNVTIRIVARVASALTFNSGKAAVLKPDTAWHIRGNSYEFQVSPLNENREMVVIRPPDLNFALPSGRYALVFGGLAYDFTVDGPITAPAQCLESFEAVNGPVFSECRPK